MADIDVWYPRKWMVENRINPLPPEMSPCKYLDQVKYEIHLKPEGARQRIFGTPDDPNSLIDNVYIEGKNPIPQDYTFFPRLPQKIKSICEDNGVDICRIYLMYPGYQFNSISKTVNPSSYGNETFFLDDIVRAIESVGKANFEIQEIYKVRCQEEDLHLDEIHGDIMAGKGGV